MGGSTVEFVDGSKAEVDDIILCTGYQFAFPFLAKVPHLFHRALCEKE